MRASIVTLCILAGLLSPQTGKTRPVNVLFSGDHPVLEGIQPFQVWDETYVHTMHNPDRTVLMERVDDAGREPWTWVRTHGKGRVFYTAYGHDERVWGHASFHRLIRNAILFTTAPTAATRGAE
jgi:type 1 glutamine amidotransferase